MTGGAPGTSGGSDDSSSSSSSSSSGGGGRRREKVTVTGRYGTKLYEPDTYCDECRRKAQGVLIIEKTRQRTDKVDPGTPLCNDHKEERVDEEVASWDNIEWKTFK